MREQDPEYLTAAQRAALEGELAELEGPKRAAHVQAIKVAREFGDLAENFEYQIARNDQGLLERRIAVLRARLSRAILIDDRVAPSNGKVAIGSLVEIEDECGERLRLELSSAGGESAVSPDSPLGRALLGAAEGETVEVHAPRGAWRAHVLAVRRTR